MFKFQPTTLKGFLLEHSLDYFVFSKPSTPSFSSFSWSQSLFLKWVAVGHTEEQQS